MKKLFLALLLFTSCYRPCSHPQISMPERFSEGEYISRCGGEEVDLVSWWGQFNDPLLTRLIERALCCNYDLEIARERICEERAKFGIYFSKLLPHINALAEVSRTRNSEGFFEVDVGPIEEDFDYAAVGVGRYVSCYMGGFDTHWEIDLFGKLQDRARAAAYDVVAQKEEVRAIHLAVASEVARLYFIIRNLQEKVHITKTFIKSEEELVKTTEEQFRAGLVSEINVLTAQSLLDVRLSILPHQEELLKNAIYSMAILLAQIPEDLVQLFDPPQEIGCTSGRIPLGIPSELLCRRGDVRAAEMRMLASGARVLAARKEMFPTLSLDGFFGYIAGSWALLPSKSSESFWIGLSSLFPIFRGGEILSKIRFETSLQYQAVLAYEKSVIQALSEMEMALNGYIQESQVLYALENQVKDNLEARKSAETLYLAGVSDFLYVLNTERSLYFSRIALAESKERLMTQLVFVYKALGGGWECSVTLSK